MEMKTGYEVGFLYIGNRVGTRLEIFHLRIILLSLCEKGVTGFQLVCSALLLWLEIHLPVSSHSCVTCDL